VIAWLLVPGAYLIGAIPTSYVAGKVTKGLDLRQHGSGNLGATNAFRVLGWRVAVPVFVVDILKGWFPAAVFPLLNGQAGMGWALGYGAAAIVGHVFSIYVGFKGGKGVATGAGVFLALAPLAVLVGLAVWISLVVLTRIVSVASILAAAVLPLAVLSTRGGDMVFLLSVVLALFVIYMHRANIGRLLRGEEHRFRAWRRPAP
jgi:acyl phosphate:glycerol-3-phosphate acyltransferase